MCPENPVGYVLLGWVHQMEYWLGSGKSPQESIEKGIELAQKALAMDDSIAEAHGLLAQFYTLKREHDKAIAEGERAVALDPGGADVHVSYGHESELRRPVGRSHSNVPKGNPTQSPRCDHCLFTLGHALPADGAV